MVFITKVRAIAPYLVLSLEEVLLAGIGVQFCIITFYSK